MRKSFLLTALIAVFLLPFHVCTAAEWSWDDGGIDHLWNNPDNWNPNEVPDINFEASCVGSPGYILIDANHVGINRAEAGYLRGPGYESACPIVIDGGELYISGRWYFSKDVNTTVTIEPNSNVYIGVMRGKSHTTETEADGIVYQNGGNVECGKFQWPLYANTVGQLWWHLDGGTLNAGYLTYFLLQDYGHIDITKGTLLIGGDAVETVDANIVAGRITAYGGDPLFRLNVLYDSNENHTIITASKRNPPDIIVDNMINWLDLREICSQWLDVNCLDSNACNDIDLNSDNTINFRDFAIFSLYWRDFFIDDPVLQEPENMSSTFQTIPYFSWSDSVKSPYPGSYQIQIASDSNFTDIVDNDEVPAVINGYVPAKELSIQSYYWRVRYVDPCGLPYEWTPASSFNIQAPGRVLNIPLGSDWNYIRATFASALASSSESVPIELRFESGTYQITQDTSDPYFLEVVGQPADILINGQGAKFVITATQESCGFFYSQNSDRIQIKDLTIDYTSDSLSQIAGKVVAIDEANSLFTVELLDAYDTFHEFEDVNEGFVLDAQGQRKSNIQWVFFPISETWGQARHFDEPNLFTFTGSSQLLEIGDYFVSTDRGGDLFYISNGSTDIVINDVNSLACRGRLVIPRKESLRTRVINCNFKKHDGVLLAAPSGGINDSGHFTWFENCTFDGSRDDMYNNHGHQPVFRNNHVEYAFRNSAWLHGNRVWYQGNTIDFPGTSGIQIGSVGISGTENACVNNAVIRDNIIKMPVRQGILSGTNLELPPDPNNGGYYNTNVLIENNQVWNHLHNQGIYIYYGDRCILKDNLINNLPGGLDFCENDWMADPNLEIGIHVQNSKDIKLIGNQILDDRIDPAKYIVVEDSNDVNIE